MEVARHAHVQVELAGALANALTAGHRGGQPCGAPTGQDLRAAVAAAVADRPNRARTWATADDTEHAALAALAPRWREVFVAAAERPQDVAVLVNQLLDDAPVHPVLVDHDGEAWHLHAHADDAGHADGIAAMCALGLATLVATGQADRLGVCGATACDRVFLDTSRNGSRRYCSSPCQARAKTAAFRARRR